MAQEQVFSDFSGGMNALAGPDKLDPKECLLAENVRLDEIGNIQSAGAFTHQNSTAYGAAAGTSTNNVHSLYFNPSIGAVSGVGQDVFFGQTLGVQASGLAASNASQQKMSFASAPNRVYFDVSSVGYWTDEVNLLTVDWTPPTVSPPGSGVTGPTVVGTGSNAASGVAWASPNNITSTASTSVASCSLNTNSGSSQALRATMGTNSFAINASAVTGIAVTLSETGFAGQACVFHVTLLKAGVPVGTTETLTPNGGGTFTFGGSNILWGTIWSQADINANNFGFQVTATLNRLTPATAEVYNGQVTIYQAVSGGFAAGTGAAGNLTGTYTWKVTFVAANGEESDASGDSNSVTLSAQQGTITSIPAGDARTTARNIYRKGNTLTAHYLVGTIQDNVSTTYSDNQTDLAALTEGVILAGDVVGDYPNTRLGSQQVRFPCLHYDRIFWIIPGTNQLVWSKPLNGFAYPVINQLDVGDSKPCTRVVSIFGELIIFKTDSIWRLTGTDESSFDLSQTPSAVGTDQSFTVWANPDKVIFANKYGLWVFNGYTSQPLTPKLDLWYKQADRTGVSVFGVNGFHPPEVFNSSVTQNFEAVGNAEKYVLAYAEEDTTQNNAILVFDLKHGNITKRAGSVPLSLAIDPVTGFIYLGDTSGFVSLLDDWNGATGGGGNINFDWQHGYQDLQRGSNKVLWALEFYLNTNGQSLTPTVYFDNGTGNEALAAITTTGLQRVVRTLQSTASRKMQNFSTRLNGSLSTVNVDGTPQVQIVHIKAMYDIRAGRARTGQ